MAEFERKSAIARPTARVLILANFADRTIWTWTNLRIFRSLNLHLGNRRRR